MNNPKRDRILEIQTQISNLREEEKQLYKELQSECDHSIVLLCEYQYMKYVESLSPLRVCLFCALQEEGYSYGDNAFKILANKTGREVRKVTRDEVYRHRIIKPLKTTYVT